MYALIRICTPLPDGFKVMNSYHVFINVFIYVFIHLFMYALIRICTPLPDDGFQVNGSCDLCIYSSFLLMCFGLFLEMHCCIVCFVNTM